VIWKEHGHILLLTLFIFPGNPYLYAQKASENVKKLIFWKKSHVWHAGMHPKMQKQ
jgi:hypothetical protein